MKSIISIFINDVAVQTQKKIFRKRMINLTKASVAFRYAKLMNSFKTGINEALILSFYEILKSHELNFSKWEVHYNEFIKIWMLYIRDFPIVYGVALGAQQSLDKCTAIQANYVFTFHTSSDNVKMSIKMWWFSTGSQ